MKIKFTKEISMLEVRNVTKKFIKKNKNNQVEEFKADDNISFTEKTIGVDKLVHNLTKIEKGRALDAGVLCLYNKKSIHLQNNLHTFHIDSDLLNRRGMGMEHIPTKSALLR